MDGEEPHTCSAWPVFVPRRPLRADRDRAASLVVDCFSRGAGAEDGLREGGGGPRVFPGGAL